MTPLGWFCLGYYLHADLWGVHSAVASEEAADDLVFSFALAVSLCAWALADARQRQKPIPRSQQIWFYVFAPLVVPGYVILTRGWRGLGWVLFHALGWFVIANLAQITALMYFR